MRHTYFLLPVILPLCAFSQSKVPSDTMIFSENPVSKNTIVRSFSNELESVNKDKQFERSIDMGPHVWNKIKEK
ncbi:hypothetical protein TUM19329_14610 [Legionella antarctica]|uniref:Uncharacterized protein n=1 Tax=Legionella antarctica TaxID=2708020 RepID=A0A6F8T4L9_9GAMM|nr:hypothetical protein [Legionella antarctica]BCA95100.1 hypothetical protein TUM19329_14610 [Legionella antarctica]